MWESTECEESGSGKRESVPRLPRVARGPGGANPGWACTGNAEAGHRLAFSRAGGGSRQRGWRPPEAGRTPHHRSTNARPPHLSLSRKCSPAPGHPQASSRAMAHAHASQPALTLRGRVGRGMGVMWGSWGASQVSNKEWQRALSLSHLPTSPFIAHSPRTHLPGCTEAPATRPPTRTLTSAGACARASTGHYYFLFILLLLLHAHGSRTPKPKHPPPPPPKNTKRLSPCLSHPPRERSG
jgi:hypothetical protein